MMNNIKKKMKLFKYLEKSISIEFSTRTQLQKNKYFLIERQNQRNPIQIKSFAKAEQRDSSVESDFKQRCKSALNQSLTFKPKGQRISTPLNESSKLFEYYRTTTKEQGQLFQALKCKQILKQSNRIHQDRWNLLSSIGSKLVREMQSNISKRQIIRNRCGQSPQKTREMKAKSMIRFDDLIQIKQVQVEKSIQKKQGKKIKLLGNKIKKKSALLSRTQPSFEQSEENRRYIRKGNTWKFFRRSFGRLSINQQEITGWQTAADR